MPVPQPAGIYRDVMLENYGHLFSGLVVSKPDLVFFLEQQRELWDVQRKETIASFPANWNRDNGNLFDPQQIQALANCVLS
ncbi:putative protein ZNF720 [Suricata suricatta]|uniref:putative protein ZNF720 n=1 Tax=Suricata suricatta TaxID=37032 RepID=UPI001155DB58|nr:putative protein ZNF720 [Suricata suricatta]